MTDTTPDPFQVIECGIDEQIVASMAQYGSAIGKLMNKRGDTLISAAARLPRPSAAAVCDILLRNGATSHDRSANGRTALMGAVIHRKFKKRVAWLLQNSVNDQDDFGHTALMFSAQGAGLFGNRRGNIRIARELLAIEADPLLEDEQGRTALGHAMKYNDKCTNSDMIEFLKENMLEYFAVREFKARNSISFNAKGVLLADPVGQK